jgi:hypothetical protein
MLDSGFMQGDIEALIMRLRYAYTADSPERFDSAFSRMSRSNAEAYFLAARMAERHGDVSEAMRLAQLCVAYSPFFAIGYELAENIAKNLEKGEQEAYLNELERIKSSALSRENPLAVFLPKDARAAQ